MMVALRRHKPILHWGLLFVCTGILSALPTYRANAESPDPTPYLAPDEQVVFSWTERYSDDDTFVQGYKIQSPSTGESRRIYLDGSGLPVAAPWNTKDKNTKSAITQPAEAAVAAPENHQKSDFQASSRRFSVAELVLAPPSSLAYREKNTGDEAEKGVYSIGVVEELSEAITLDGSSANNGEWFTEADGALTWILRIRYLDAWGIRLKISELSLPDGCTLHLYGEASGTTDTAVTESGWTPTVSGEAATLELRLPSGADIRLLHLTLERLAYLYENPLTGLKSVGECQNDIACFPDYLSASYAVGRLAMAGDTDVWACTGVLLADTTAETQIPYILTANHCISKQSEAGSLEVYWQFAAAACNGSEPDISDSLRTTGGATLLAGAAEANGSDFAFLRLKNKPPSGVTYAGFSTEAVAAGTAVVAIHHPNGERQRISFGHSSLQGRPVNKLPLVSRDRFWEVLWNDGSTEPGSSGCPLFLEGTGLVVGQLYGGYASCKNMTEPDYFGRFNVTYEVVQRWLDPTEPIPEEGETTEGEGEGEGEGETGNQCQSFDLKGKDSLILGAAITVLLLLVPGRNGNA